MSTITLPKKIVKEIFEAGRRFAAAEDALEDALLARDPRFLKKMRMLRKEKAGELGQRFGFCLARQRERQ